MPEVTLVEVVTRKRGDYELEECLYASDPSDSRVGLGRVSLQGVVGLKDAKRVGVAESTEYYKSVHVDHKGRHDLRNSQALAIDM